MGLNMRFHVAVLGSLFLVAGFLILGELLLGILVLGVLASFFMIGPVAYLLCSLSKFLKEKREAQTKSEKRTSLLEGMLIPGAAVGIWLLLIITFNYGFMGADFLMLVGISLLFILRAVIIAFGFLVAFGIWYFLNSK